MKNLLLAFLFLFAASITAQVPIDYETTGNNWTWNIFSQGTNGSFDVVANPAPSGINSSDSCAKLIVDTNGDAWGGVWTSDFPDLLLTPDNCIIRVLVYKDAISNFNVKLEGFTGYHDNNVPNTVTNQWEELFFDYSSDIGKTATVLTIIPDFSPIPRTYGSTSYWDYIRFTPQPLNVNFETFGNSWNWIVFDSAKEVFDVVANPSIGGLNATDSCAMLQITDVTADPWAGVFAIDFPDMVFDANNCIVKILVYKDHISNVGVKIEPARSTDYNIPNTVINQWEEIVFDYSAYIGSNANTLVVIPDFSDGPPRTYTSTSYFDEIRFTAQALPVELTSFTGAYVGNDVQLNWSTATELNNRGFEIQRSANGSQFATVAFVEGHGTTTEQQKYSFVDNTVNTRTNYAYRLKQVDFNGNYEYSSVVNVGSTLPAQFILEQNYPNPFNPSTRISFAVPVKSNVTLEVYNLIGERLMTLMQGEVEAGTETVTFNANGLSSGIYLVKMNAIGENGTEFTSSKKMTLLK
jgi:hypothetical protein